MALQHDTRDSWMSLDDIWRQQTEMSSSLRRILLPTRLLLLLLPPEDILLFLLPLQPLRLLKRQLPAEHHALHHVSCC